MGDIQQRECTQHDVFALSMILADADHKELMALGVVAPDDDVFEALERCVTNSVKTYSVYKQGAILAIGGYTASGNCWFLSSKHLANLSKPDRYAFRQLLMRNLMDTLKIFPVLCNSAWAKNTQHLRLIESCGGRIGTAGYIPNGEEFVYFEFRREDYPQLN